MFGPLGWADALTAINPLIYASFSAFGQKAPRGPQTAYDHVIQATSGIMAMTDAESIGSARAVETIRHDKLFVPLSRAQAWGARAIWPCST